jgi:hypothetical protein
MRKSMKNRKTNNKTKKRGSRAGEILKNNPNFTSFTQIYNIAFDFPGETDYYKYLRYAQMDLVDDMHTSLHKEEMHELNLMPKYMYLIRAKNSIDKNNTVMHYICINQSMNMLDVVFPFYLILHNHTFKELLQYYLNLKNGDGYLPLDLLFLGGGIKGLSLTKTGNASRVVKQVTGMGKSLVDRATRKEPKKRIYCILTLFGAKFSENFKRSDEYRKHSTTIREYDAFCKTWEKTPHNIKTENRKQKTYR